VNWKNTWILVGLAAALFAFIALFERHMKPSGYVEPPPPLLASFKPSAATTVQLRRGTQPALTLVRSNDTWHFTQPFVYPAAQFTVNQFLEALEKIVPATRITPRELAARKQTPADFGFDPPPVVVTLADGRERRELRIGGRTASGDQVYVEVVGTPGYSVVGAALLDQMLPRSPHEWRDTAIFRFGDERLERVEVVQSQAGFTLALDPTNKLWRLARPPHRADQLQVRQLIDKLVAARALEFVADGPQIDPESFGLRTPEYELALSAGGVTQRVQFGHSPTNDPARVYARLLTHSNVVLVPTNYVALLATPYSELRDRQLVAFAPEMVDVVEAQVGTNKYRLRKNPAGGWTADDQPADSAYVLHWLNELSRVIVTEFVKDVVNDFTPYGLAPPQRSYTLNTIVTNAAGPTNVFIARVDFGTNTTNAAFARRWDEESVYAVRLHDFMQMPGAAWQFREHRIWNFTTNQVSKITVTQGAKVTEAVRQPDGQWVAVKGFENEMNPFAMEELAVQLGNLTAMNWVARGEPARAVHGFTGETPRLSVELRGEKPQTLSVEFGRLSPLLQLYALTTIDGQPYVFEFPWTIFADLQRYFGLSPAGMRGR